MSLITFVCASPSASWEPTHNPVYGSDDARMIRRHQPVDMAGADVYSYNKGQSCPVSLKWAAMPTADLAALIAFFATVAGHAKTFVYTDWNGTAYTARKADRGLTSRYVGTAFHEVTVDLEVSV